MWYIFQLIVKKAQFQILYLILLVRWVNGFYVQFYPNLAAISTKSSICKNDSSATNSVTFWNYCSILTDESKASKWIVVLVGILYQSISGDGYCKNCWNCKGEKFHLWVYLNFYFTWFLAQIFSEAMIWITGTKSLLLRVEKMWLWLVQIWSRSKWNLLSRLSLSDLEFWN